MARKIGENTAQKPAGNRGKGRPKGAKNKVTASAREAMTLAFDGIGGVDALQSWAAENQTEFYKLWGRLIPQEVKNEHTGKDGGPIAHQTWIVNGREIAF